MYIQICTHACTCRINTLHLCVHVLSCTLKEHFPSTCNSNVHITCTFESYSSYWGLKATIVYIHQNSWHWDCCLPPPYWYCSVRRGGGRGRKWEGEVEGGGQWWEREGFVSQLQECIYINTYIDIHQTVSRLHTCICTRHLMYIGPDYYCDLKPFELRRYTQIKQWFSLAYLHPLRRCNVVRP